MDVKNKAKLAPEQKADIIEAARFAHARSTDPFMDDKEWAIFRDGVNRDAQAKAAEEFKGRRAKK